MKLHFMRFIVIFLGAILILAACAAPEPATPTVDVIGTMAVELAFGMQTQTAAAYSPTPLPATATITPSPTQAITPTIAPTKRPVTVNFAPCYFGPGPDYGFESNINPDTKLDLLGVGSVSGWYVVQNPYFHQPCWILGTDLQFDPNMDLTVFPVMTPGH